MAYAMCPLCGRRTHKNVGAPVAHERAYPSLRTVGVAIDACAVCRELLERAQAGTRVRVRVRRTLVERSDDWSGQLGTIERCARGDDGLIFLVRLDAGATELFLTAELEALGLLDPSR